LRACSSRVSSSRSSRLLSSYWSTKFRRSSVRMRVIADGTVAAVGRVLRQMVVTAPITITKVPIHSAGRNASQKIVRVYVRVKRCRF